MRYSIAIADRHIASYTPIIDSSLRRPALNSFLAVPSTARRFLSFLIQSVLDQHAVNHTDATLRLSQWLRVSGRQERMNSWRVQLSRSVFQAVFIFLEDSDGRGLTSRLVHSPISVFTSWPHIYEEILTTDG